MTARPDQTGKFQIRGLPAGEYYLATVDPAEQGEWFEPAYLDEHRAGRRRASRSADGDVKTQDFKRESQNRGRQRPANVRLSRQLSQVSPQELQHADRRDRHRVGAQRAAAERHQPHAAAARGRPLLLRPPALGSDQDRRVVRRPAAPRSADSGSTSAVAPGSTSISVSAAGGSSRQRLEASAACRISGTHRPPRLLHRRQRHAPPAIDAARRASAPPRSSRLAPGDDRLDRPTTPSITASRTMSSILSPLSTACTSVSATPASAAGSTRDTICTRTSRRSARDDAREELVAAAVEDRRPCRRRPAAARASGARPRRAAASTVSSPGSSAGAKNRCTAQDYRFTVHGSTFTVRGSGSREPGTVNREP